VIEPTRFAFAVVGGGLAGAAIAYGLSRLQRSVALLDEGDVAYRAARGNFGLIWVQGKGIGLPRYSNWTQASARRWPELAAALRDETVIDVALDQRGGFHVCLSERELESRTTMLRRLVAQDGIDAFEFETLDRRALAGRVSGIGADVAGATFTKLDGHVNPLRLLRALHEAFQRRGGVYLPDSRIETVRPFAAGGGTRFAVATMQRSFVADRVVLAAGLGNARLAPHVGLSAPVRPQRGQIIVLERVKPFLAYPTATLRQTDDGTVLIGDSQEETGFDESVGLPVLAAMADRARRMFPALTPVRVTRAWGALRVMSPDGFPVYEQSRTAPGAFVVTCHSGVTLAAAHALELSPQIAAGALDPALDVFASARFDVQKAA
jgi:glycine/D-amino acid oxidase-like deaminating enzyme